MMMMMMDRLIMMMIVMNYSSIRIRSIDITVTSLSLINDNSIAIMTMIITYKGNGR